MLSYCPILLLITNSKKTPIMLKCQQFENSESNETKSKELNCQQFDQRNNKKKLGLNNNKSEIKDNRYFFSLFLLFFFFSKKSQTACQIWIKKLETQLTLYTYQKITSQRDVNFAIEFLSKVNSKARKTSCLREDSKTHLAFITLIASSTTNYYRLIKKRLELHPPLNYCQGLKTQSCSNQQYI